MKIIVSANTNAESCFQFLDFKLGIGKHYTFWNGRFVRGILQLIRKIAPKKLRLEDGDNELSSPKVFLI
jgi:hypothetical protein